MPHYFFGIIAFSLMVFSLWRFIRNLKSAAFLDNTAISKIRSVPQGYVELEGVGKVMEGPPIIAPLSHLSCVWYRYKVEELAGRDWTVVEQGASSDVFLLEDGTGVVAIDPDGAQVTCKHREHWVGTRGLGPTWWGNAGVFQDARRRYMEERIHVGEKIYALGLIKNIGDLAPSDIDEEIGSLLHEWKQDQTQLKARFDLNHDGEIDAQEWMLAQAQARREVLKAQRQSLQQSSESLNLMKNTSDGRPYVLSAYSKQETIARYRLWALFYVALFLTTAMISFRTFFSHSL